MKAYISVFKLRFILLLQYRAAAFAGLCTQFAFGSMHIMVMMAYYKAVSSSMPMTLQQTISYIWLTQAFLGIVALWTRDGEIMELIRSGNIAYELARPLDIYNYWYFRGIAMRTAPTLLRCIPLLCVVFFLPKGFRLMLPPSIPYGLLFIFSLLLAILLVSSISNLTYMLTMFSVSGDGIILITAVLGELLSGMLLPLPLMPDWIQRAIAILPFRGILDTPFRIYLGNISLNDIPSALLHQTIWTILLIILGKIIFTPIRRRVIIQGG